MTRFEAAKQVSIAGFYGQNGYEIDGAKAKTKAIAFWRGESVPSVSIDNTNNLWYDHGAGTGGSVIELAAAVWRCSPCSAAERLAGGDYERYSVRLAEPKPSSSRIYIRRVEGLHNWVLCNYCLDRGIPVDVAKEYLKEVYYSVGEGDREFYAVGLKMSGETDGWALRNSKVKLNTRKGVSHILNGRCDRLLVFEGMFNMLTYDTVHRKAADYLVLNSVTNAKEALGIIGNYKSAELWLDNDKAGDTATQTIQDAFRYADDMRFKYKDYNDLNEYWMAVK